MTLFAMIHDDKPVPQSRARVTRFGVFYGKEATAHRKDLTAAMLNHVGDDWNAYPLSGPLAVRIAIAGANVTSDVDNHAKMVLDALQDAGVLASDDIRTVAELTVRVVAGEPRTVISIETL